MARLVARDGQAPFAELYERYHQALYRYCRSIVRDEHDAQDALQSAMAGAFAALRKGERDLAVRPWLFRIAHNESVSLLRRRRPQEITADELALAAPANISEPATIVEQRERLAMLLGDLRGLTIRQRSALLMRELSGLSIEEIAAASSSTPGAVKQTLFEAREALRENERGRSMECEQVRRLIYEDDRRALRGRRVSSHLRACAGCRERAEGIAARRQDLRLLAPPLPAVAATALLSRLLATGAGMPGAASGGPGAAAGATQAATGGSGGAGAGASGAGPAGSAASSVAVHTGGAIAAKVLSTAVVVAVGAAGVAGVASSGSASPGSHREAVGRANSSHGLIARHSSPRGEASSRERGAGGRPRSRAGHDGTKRTPASAHNQRVAAPHASSRSGAQRQEGDAHASGPKHSHEAGRASAPGRARARRNVNHGRSHGHQPRSRHAAAPSRAAGKNRAEGHRSPASSKPTAHPSRKAPARGKPKPPPKEASDGHGSGKGHGKQAAGTSGTSVHDETMTVEASPGEHGKRTRQPPG